MHILPGHGWGNCKTFLLLYSAPKDDQIGKKELNEIELAISYHNFIGITVLKPKDEGLFSKLPRTLAKNPLWGLAKMKKKE